MPVISAVGSANGSPAVIRGLGWVRGVAAVRQQQRGETVAFGLAMLGTMMYPTEESLEDMRVPPIQLEHLPEVFLCT